MQVLWWCLLAVGSPAWARRDPDPIAFPGPVRDRRRSTPEPSGIRLRLPEACHTSLYATNNSTIPLRLAQQLKGVSNLDDLVERLANKEAYYKSPADIAADSDELPSGLNNVWTNPVVVPAEVPECKVQPTLVYFDQDLAGVGDVVIPSCVRIDRCSACCVDPSLECRPKDVLKLYYNVSVFGLSNDGKLIIKSSNVVNLNQHFNCECGCRVKPEHCNTKQKHRPDLCKCVCPIIEREFCNFHSDRLYDDHTCTCNCFGSTECTTGTYFNQKTCRCQKEKMQVMWWWLFAVWSLAWARRDPDDTIVFPGPVRDRRRSTPEPPGIGLGPPEGCRTTRCAMNNSTIPLSLVQQLNEVSDLNELVERFITNKEDYYESLAVTAADGGGLALRFGNDGTPKAIQAKIPECIPQPSLVFVEPEDSEAGSLLLPSCIRVDRCSGCCHSPALECQPTREDELLYKISVLGLSYNGMLKFRHSRTVNVRKHVKCKCGCRIKQEDCNTMQMYRPDLCQCECPGADREACDSQFDRFWEEASCSCQCLAETDCSTGTFFDKAICRCRKYP